LRGQVRRDAGVSLRDEQPHGVLLQGPARAARRRSEESRSRLRHFGARFELNRSSFLPSRRDRAGLKSNARPRSGRRAGLRDSPDRRRQGRVGWVRLGIVRRWLSASTSAWSASPGPRTLVAQAAAFFLAGLALAGPWPADRLAHLVRLAIEVVEGPTDTCGDRLRDGEPIEIALAPRCSQFLAHEFQIFRHEFTIEHDAPPGTLSLAINPSKVKGASGNRERRVGLRRCLKSAARAGLSRFRISLG